MTIPADYIERRRARAEQTIAICREIYPMRGLIVSPDIDRGFEIVKKHFPDVAIHEYPTGMTCEDWIVPQSWRAVSGFLKDASGKTLASLDEHFLFVAAYSEPVDGWFTKKEIEGRCRTRPDQPDCYVLEHRNAYDYRRTDWGITLPHRVWSAMTDDTRYHIKIEVERRPGSLKAAEWFLPGRREETICINSQFDELCNDGHSSAVLGLQIMQWLKERKDREFSYQLLLTPEMFGTLFFILTNLPKVANTVGFLNLETLGAGEKWLFKHSQTGATFMDDALAAAFADLGIGYDEAGFFGGYGNDERVYGWPTLAIPGIALQRHPFAYYHTSKDTPDILSADLFAESLAISERFIEVLEGTYIPSYRNVVQPWLTRHGLYFDHYVNPEDFQRLNNLALFNVNGRNSLLDLVKISGVKFDTLHTYLEQFAEKNLLEKRPFPVDRPARHLHNQG